MASSVLHVTGVVMLTLGCTALFTAMLSVWARFVDKSDVPQTRFSAFDKGDELFWHYIAVIGGTGILSTYAGLKVYVNNAENIWRQDECSSLYMAGLTLMTLLHPTKAWFFIGVGCCMTIGTFGAASVMWGVELYEWIVGDNVAIAKRRRARRRARVIPVDQDDVLGNRIDQYNLLDAESRYTATAFSLEEHGDASPTAAPGVQGGD